MASRLIAIGVATPRIVDYGDFKSLLLCPIVEPDAQPELEASPDTVQVSFWQSGARAGMFSQKAYPVLDRTKTLVKVELMPGIPKWYPVAQVKAA